MIVHVLRRAEAAAHRPRSWSRPTARTIAAAVEKAGGRAVMTRADHVSGSDRIFEALNKRRPARPQPTSSSTCRAICRRSRQPISRAALAPLADPAVDIATLAAEITKRGGAHQSERRQGRRLAGRAATAARALFHPRHRALRRRPALSSHRALRLSPRGAGALRRAAALAARTAREARAAARAGSRHAHRRRPSSTPCRSASIRPTTSTPRARMLGGH